MDKLSKFDKNSNPLRSKLSRHFTYLVHGATHKENAGVLRTTNEVNAKAVEIFGKKRGSLAKIFKINAKIIKKSGVNLYDEDGRVTVRDHPVSQNTAYKKWMEWQDVTIRDDMKRQGITQQTINQIEDFLTPEVKAWARYQLEGFYQDYHDGTNEVFKALTYTDMPKGENYSPTRREYNRGSKEDMTVDGSASYHSSMWKGSHKRRVKNNRDLKWVDGDVVLAQHVAEQEHFKAWALAVRDMRSVFGNERVRKAIIDHHGKSAMAVVDDFIERFVSGGVEARNRIGWIDHIRSGFTKLALGLNLVVYIKQLTSFPAYAMDIPATEFSKGLTIALANPLRAARILMDSPMMQARYELSQMERDMSFAARKTAAKKFAKTKNISDYAMTLTKMGDKAAIITGGYSVYRYYYKRQMKSNGGNHQASHEYALREFEIATEAAQQAAGQKDLSVFQTGSSIQKLFSMFMTTTASYLRIWESGWRNLYHGRGSKAGNLKKIAITHLLLPILFQLAASGGEWDEQKQKRAVFVGPFVGLFIFRDVISAIADRLFLGKYYGYGGAPPLSALTDFIDTLTTKGIGVEELSHMIAALRPAVGMKDAMEGKTEHPIRRSIGYSESALNPIKTAYGKHNSDYNRVMRDWKEDPKNSPRPNMRLKAIKKQIARAKKNGNSKQEKKLMQQFIDHAKSL